MHTLIPKKFSSLTTSGGGGKGLPISTDAAWHREGRTAAQGSREVSDEAEGNTAQTPEVYLLQYHRGERLAGFPEGVAAGPAFLSLLFSAVYL